MKELWFRKEREREKKNINNSFVFMRAENSYTTFFYHQHFAELFAAYFPLSFEIRKKKHWACDVRDVCAYVVSAIYTFLALIMMKFLSLSLLLARSLSAEKKMSARAKWEKRARERTAYFVVNEEIPHSLLIQQKKNNDLMLLISFMSFSLFNRERGLNCYCDAEKKMLKDKWRWSHYSLIHTVKFKVMTGGG